MKRVYLATLEERMNRMCYQHILPHLDRYRAEPDIEQCLPLMEPQVFASFATQACLDVAGLVEQVMRKLSRRRTREGTSYAVALRDSHSEYGDEGGVRDHLAQSLTGFANALERYAPVIARFRQMVGQACQSSWENGCAIGEWAANQFGGLAGILAGVVGGYFSGSAIDRQMEAETERLHQAFQVMLEAYDQAMDDLKQSAINVICRHSS